MIYNSTQNELVIADCIEILPDPFLIPDELHQAQLLKASDLLLSQISDYSDLCKLESKLLQQKDNYPLSLHVAIKLAQSKSRVNNIDKNLKVSVVFAAYKEHQRILTQEQHPHGENFLIQKVNQLNWLFSQNQEISWQLLMVDDGCPDKTGEIAESIISEYKLSNQVGVLYLQDALDEKLPIAKNLSSVNDSRKGGSVQYGMWHASLENIENHIIAYTDADLSTHLGQLGLLIHPIIHEKKAAIGSRRENNSVVIKTGTRNTRGKLFIYLWKRILHPLNFVVDTQCGFKAFHGKLVKEIIEDNIEQKFAFDIELLLRTQMKYPDQIENIGISWIDSEAASTTKDLQPYLSMLQMIARMYEKYLPSNHESTDFANFILALSEENWQKLVTNVPSEIADKEPMQFDSFNKVKVHHLDHILRS